MAGGTLYSVKGGGTNYQCLPRDPQWGAHTDGLHSHAYMHGVEYEMPHGNSPFLKVYYFIRLSIMKLELEQIKSKSKQMNLGGFIPFLIQWRRLLFALLPQCSKVSQNVLFSSS